MKQFLPALACLAALSSACIPAHAADRQVDTVSVNYSDLDLTKSAGVATLRHRLIIASRDVCGEGGSAQLGGAAEVKACREAALQDSLRELRRAVASASVRHDTAVATLAAK